MASKLIHGDTGGDADVDRASGAEGLNIAHIGGRGEEFGGETIVFGTEEESGVFGEGFFVEGLGAVGIVFDGD